MSVWYDDDSFDFCREFGILYPTPPAQEEPSICVTNPYWCDLCREEHEIPRNNPHDPVCPWVRLELAAEGTR